MKTKFNHLNQAISSRFKMKKALLSLFCCMIIAHLGAQLPDSPTNTARQITKKALSQAQFDALLKEEASIQQPVSLPAAVERFDEKIISPDGRYVVAYNVEHLYTDKLYFYTVDGVLLREFYIGFLPDIKYGASGKFLEVFNDIGKEYFIFSNSGEVVHQGLYNVDIKTNNEYINDICYMEDQNMVVFCTSGGVHAYSLIEQKTLWRSYNPAWSAKGINQHIAVAEINKQLPTYNIKLYTVSGIVEEAIENCENFNFSANALAYVRSDKKIKKDNKEFVANGDELVWPLSRNQTGWNNISSTFGERHAEIHHAIDISVANGTNFKAAVAGIVKANGDFPKLLGCDMCVCSQDYLFRHGDECRLTVNSNSFVEANTIIGKVLGKDHLHFEVYKWDGNNWISLHPLRKELVTFKSSASKETAPDEDVNIVPSSKAVINDIVFQPDAFSGIIIKKTHSDAGMQGRSVEKVREDYYIDQKTDLMCDSCVIVHIDNTMGKRRQKTHSLFNREADTIVVWGAIGTVLQTRDIPNSVGGTGYTVMGAEYFANNYGPLFKIDFDRLSGEQGQEDNVTQTSGEQRISSMYKTSLNDCVQNCPNEEYTGNSDWLKLSHLQGESRLNFHKVQSDGVWYTRSSGTQTPSPFLYTSRANQEAKYKEGFNELRYIVYSLNRTSKTVKIPVIVDNFKPYIASVKATVNQKNFGNYLRTFDVNTGRVFTTSETGKCITKKDLNKHRIEVIIEASEPLSEMTQVRAFIDNLELLLEEPPTRTDTTGIKWRVLFQPPLNIDQIFEKDIILKMEISGKDLANNALLPFAFSETNTPSNFTIPTRKSATVWEQEEAFKVNAPDRGIFFNIPKQYVVRITGGGNIQYCRSFNKPEITLTANTQGGKAPFQFLGGWRHNSPDDSYADLKVGESGIYTAHVIDDRGCEARWSAYVGFTPIICLRSADPNEIAGPTGVDTVRWVARRDTLSYTVHFENEAKSATAPAQRVRLDVPIPPEADPSTFRIGRIGFAGKTFELPPGRIQYQGRLDARDSVGVYVDVTAGLNVEGTKAFWILQAVDPATGMSPENPALGLLPINDSISRRGTGFAEFSIKARRTTVTGDTLPFRAEIIFDDNEVIPTNRWKNQIDAVAPQSLWLSASGRTLDSTRITLQWTGQDDPGGSGIGKYKLWVARDSSAFQVETTALTDTQYTYEAAPGHYYQFALQAVDRTGNEERLDTTHTVGVWVKDNPYLQFVSLNNIGLCGGDSLRVTWTSNSIDSINITFSLDHGQSFAPLATGVPDSLRYFAFQTGLPAQDQTIILAISNAANPRQSDTVEAVVHPKLVVSAGPKNAAICAGSALELVASAPGALNYAWFPAFSLDRSDSSHVQVKAGETTTYIVAAGDINGCVASDTVTVTVYPRDSIYFEEIVCSPADTGLIRQALSNRFGCDSIVVVYRLLDNFPPIALAKNISIMLDGNGHANLQAADLDDGSFDDCGVTLQISRTQFTCADTGRQLVWLRVTDPAGHVDSTAAVVTVLASSACQSPGFVFEYSGPDTLYVPATACSAPLYWGNNTPTATAAAGRSLAAFALDAALTGYPLGAAIPANTNVRVAYVATDNLMFKDTFYFNITVIDSIPPAITCPPNTTVAANAQCAGAIGTYTPVMLSDNCGNALAVQSPLPGAPLSGLNNSQTVRLTASDAQGNSAECSFTVTLQDATPPQMVCPPNTTVHPALNYCTRNLGTWAPLSLDDNCGNIGLISIRQSPPADTTLSHFQIPQTVRLTARDVSGNEQICQFTVTLVDVQPPAITCPPNTTVAANAQCAGAIGTYTPVMLSDNCGNAVAVQSPLPSAPLSGLNNSQTVRLTASDAQGNSAECSFTVTLQDATPPQMVCPPNTTVHPALNYCTRNLGTWTPLILDDNCGNVGLISIRQSPPADTTLSHFQIPQTVRLTARDVSGNEQICQFTVTLVDVQPPTITCPPSPTPVTGAGANCSAAFGNVNATYADACQATSLQYLRQGASSDSGSGQLSGVAFNSGTTTVTYTTTDAGGLTATCSFSVTVLPCQTGLSGRVIWKQDNSSGVKDVSIQLSGAQTAGTTTPLSGNYAFPAVSGANFTITPSKNTNKLNGLNASDVLRIQQHLSGNPITDPWQLIAADVNGNNLVSSLDANIIQLSLLNNPQALAQFTKSWRFVPTSHTLSNPPWGFPEQITLAGVTGSQSNLNFYGVKIGDLASNYANPANSGAGAVCSLHTLDQTVKAGETVLVEMALDPVASVAALQLALHFDPRRLQLKAAKPLSGFPLHMDDFGVTEAAAGEIRLVWANVQPVQLRNRTAVFQLEFTALENVSALREVLDLSASDLPALVFDAQMKPTALALCFERALDAEATTDAAEYLYLAQNRPNPFRQETRIEFVLPGPCQAQLRILDAAGRLLHERTGNYVAGSHTEVFTLDLPAGLYFYELLTPYGVRTRRMAVAHK